MEYTQREYALFSACGLNCGLCPRYHTNGTSRCPGCAGAGFADKHPACGVLSCAQRHQVDYCCLCGEFPCPRYDNADQADSFITHRNQFADLAKWAAVGQDAYRAELDNKVEILRELLADYDDGRRKSFYCIAVNLLDLRAVQEIMETLRALAGTVAVVKERAALAVRLLQKAAMESNIDLKLRKKQGTIEG